MTPSEQLLQYMLIDLLNNDRIPVTMRLEVEHLPSIAERIGQKAIAEIAYKSTPFPWKLLPYSRAVLTDLLENNQTLAGLEVAHYRKFEQSPAFRIFRPRWSAYHQMLEGLGIE